MLGNFNAPASAPELSLETLPSIQSPASFVEAGDLYLFDNSADIFRMNTNLNLYVIQHAQTNTLS